MAEKPSPYPDQQPPGSGYPPPSYGPTQPAYPPPPPPGYSTATAYPTQPGYPAATTTTTIIHQPTHVVNAISFGESPVAMQCPNCKQNIVTATSYVTGTLTWLACLGLCVVGCDAGCCLIPFCVDAVKDVIHICPSCGTQLGVFRRM